MDSDQDSDEFYWILKLAYSMVLLNGDSNGALHPKDPMTRAELASVLLRFHELLTEAQSGETNTNTLELNVEVIGTQGDQRFRISLKDINYEELELAESDGKTA